MIIFLTARNTWLLEILKFHMCLVFVVCMCLYLMTLWICGLKAYVEIFLKRSQSI